MKTTMHAKEQENQKTTGTLPAAKEENICLSKIWKENSHLKELSWFLGEALRYTNAIQKPGMGPDIVLLDSSLPLELPLAAGAKTLTLLGGSHAFAEWAGDLVPRDADAQIRSILGALHAPAGMDFSKSLLVIPLTCDGMRKIAFLLKKEGFQTFPVDIHPVKGQHQAEKLWEEQLFSLMEAIEEHMGKKITREALSHSRKVISQAKASLLSFWQMTWDCEKLISPAARLLIRNSFYLARDISEWSWHLDRLKEELGRSKRRRGVCDYKPGIMLLGSPVLFPSYKIPFLLQDCGLSLLDVADEYSMALRCMQGKTRLGLGRKECIRQMARELATLDASPSYVENRSLLRHVKRLICQGGIDGAVLHVLKGQIEQDFLLPQLEKLLEAENIPLFRLETDYNDHDVEQLRIRMEAFSEMLSQNLYLEAERA